MNILSLEINNILSIEKCRIDYGSSGITLIDGWNHDDDSANGAGKTAILNAQTFGLFGKLPRKISASEILRHDTKNGYVSITLEASNGDIISVTRHRPKKTEFIVNNISVDMTQEEFEDKIGLSYDQYLICAYSAQIESEKFILLNDSDKKNFILKLMNLDKFNIYKKIADNKLKELSNKKQEIEKTIIQCKSKLSVYKEKIIDVDDINLKITKLNTSELESDIKKLSSILAPNCEEYDKSYREVDSQLNNLESQESEVLKLKTILKLKAEQYEKLSNVKQSSVVNCPNCDHKIVLTGSEAVSLQDIINQRKQEQKELKHEISELVDKINSFPSIKDAKYKLKEKRQDIIERKNKELHSYNKTQQKISELKSLILLRKTQIDTLKQSLEENQNNQNKINQLEDLIKNADKVLIKVSKDIEIISAISHALSPTGAPAYMVDSVVELINKNIISFVEQIWPGADYSIQSFKENKNGDMVAKFSEKLIILGKERSIGSLSNGEFRCLCIATDLAIINVVESMFGIKINPIVFDEPFEGLDSSNRERAVQMLEMFAESRQVIIIDHASEAKAMFSDIIKIEKKDGISRLVQ